MVWQILSFLSNGDSVDDILAAYSALKLEDIHACLHYAAVSAKERVVPLQMIN